MILFRRGLDLIARPAALLLFKGTVILFRAILLKGLLLAFNSMQPSGTFVYTFRAGKRKRTTVLSFYSIENQFPCHILHENCIRHSYPSLICP